MRGLKIFSTFTFWISPNLAKVYLRIGWWALWTTSQNWKKERKGKTLPDSIGHKFALKTKKNAL